MPTERHSRPLLNYRSAVSEMGLVGYFDVPDAEVESVVQLDHVTDNLGGNRWRLYVFIGGLSDSVS